jgi:hypothetical protein
MEIDDLAPEFRWSPTCFRRLETCRNVKWNHFRHHGLVAGSPKQLCGVFMQPTLESDQRLIHLSLFPSCILNKQSECHKLEHANKGAVVRPVRHNVTAESFLAHKSAIFGLEGGCNLKASGSFHEIPGEEQSRAGTQQRVHCRNARAFRIGINAKHKTQGSKNDRQQQRHGKNGTGTGYHAPLQRTARPRLCSLAESKHLERWRNAPLGFPVTSQSGCPCRRRRFGVYSRFAPVRRLITAGIELVGRATPGARVLYPSMAEIFTCLPSV